MRRRWLEILMGLAAIPAAPSTAAAVSPPPARPSTSSLTTESKPQKSFYINKPASDNDGAAAIVQRREIVPRTPLESHKLIFDTSDSRRALDDWELEDYVLVATIEGDLFALDRYSGATKWVLDGNGAAVQSRHLQNETPEPTNSSNAQTDPIADNDQQPRWIVQPVEGGQLFLFDEEFGVLELPLTIKQLIDHGAFKIPGDDKVYTGRKESQFVAVDSKTGKVLSQYGSPAAAFMSAKCRAPRDPLDDLDDECDASVDGRDVLMIGKTVYHLTITSGDDLTWDLTYSEWTPNMIDSYLTDQYVKVQDDLYVCPSSEGLVYMHNPSHESALWTKSLGSSAINSFDVFRPSFEDPSMFKEPPSLVLIRQPPTPFFQKPPSQKVATFLNTTEEGAWYALSTDRYPLLTSRVGPAPWVTWNETDDRNVSKEDLVGIHPIAKTLEMNLDNPGLPAPNMPKLIEGGDWQRRHRHSHHKHSLFFVLGLIIVFLAIWKRRSFPRVRFGRRRNIANAVEENAIEITPTPPPPREEEYNEKMPLVSSGEGSEVVDEPKTESIENQQNGEASAPERKVRRKRGQRGGKNNKKKVGFVEGTADMDEEDLADVASSYVQFQSPTPVPRELPMNDQGNYTIEGLTITDKLLGSGSQGTFVYEGMLDDGRKVAVKRMQIENFEIADKEVSHLRDSEHPNIVRYHFSKRSDKFIYIVIELCQATLEHIIVRGHEPEYSSLAGPNLQKQYALLQIASGLEYLHSLKIVHRDLKPQNILVVKPKHEKAPVNPLWRNYKPDQTRCLISDFGLCKKLEPGHSTFQAQSAMAAGTSGWRAPEVLRGVESGGKDAASLTSDEISAMQGSNRRITRAVDIFSMGCLFYYVLTDGEHPFGNLTYLRDGRIMDNQFDLSALDCSTNDGVEAKDLISRMISPNPDDRPNAAKVLEHPYFWDDKRRTDFILAFSDRLHTERDSPLAQRVESAAPEICGKDWTSLVDVALMKDSRVNRSYDGTKINDLIRLIRNKKSHQNELSEQVRKRLNDFEPDGYIGYFLYKRFPKLLLHLYDISEDESLGIPLEEWYLKFRKSM